MSFAKGISKQYLEKHGIELKEKQGSELEGAFAALLFDPDIPEPEREQCLIDGRKYRCDFVWRAERVIFEIEGGTYSGGRHTRGKGFEEDCRKYNLLTLEGWQVFRVTGAHIKSGEALIWLRRALDLEA